ncbi:MAG: signal peptidase I [Planctomycetes bacterium]|jgi:signal peptidase I/rubredoxin|nr:signal peptidase I [Planctomycetota bacterium]
MAADKKKSGDLGQVRDLVESVYVAIVLAFVLRAFLVEAFVIPTGSMATSLYGEHFTLRCPACGYVYAYGRTGGTDEGRAAGGVVPSNAYCPNCGFHYASGSAGAPTVVPPRGGDRVLVLKYLYDFGSPQPWDVVVFKNPQTNRENYIKRLIGLPGETIEIVGGDVFVTRPGEDQPRIRRKPPATQQAVWEVLHDSDYPPRPEAFSAVNGRVPWPGWQAGLRGAAWEVTHEGGRRFHFAGNDRPAVLEYRPGSKGFCPLTGYNPHMENRRGRDDDAICTDWKLRCVLTAGEQPMQLAMVFESYADRFRAEFETAGRVRLMHQRRDADSWDLWGEADIGAFTPGQGRVIALAVADGQAWLSVDEQRVVTSTDKQFKATYDAAVRRAELSRRIQQAHERADDIRSGVERLRRVSQPTDEQRRELASLKQGLIAAESRCDGLQQLLLWAERPAVMMDATGGAADVTHVRLMHDLYYTSPYLPLPDAGDVGPQFNYVRGMQGSVGAPGGPNHWRKHDGRYLGWVCRAIRSTCATPRTTTMTSFSASVTTAPKATTVERGWPPHRRCGCMAKTARWSTSSAPCRVTICSAGPCWYTGRPALSCRLSGCHWCRTSAR